MHSSILSSFQNYTEYSLIAFFIYFIYRLYRGYKINNNLKVIYNEKLENIQKIHELYNEFKENQNMPASVIQARLNTLLLHNKYKFQLIFHLIDRNVNDLEDNAKNIYDCFPFLLVDIKPSHSIKFNILFSNRKYKIISVLAFVVYLLLDFCLFVPIHTNWITLTTYNEIVYYYLGLAVGLYCSFHIAMKTMIVSRLLEHSIIE